MKFFSTRDHSRIVTASQAIAQGLSDEGGLFVPESFPQVDVEALCQLDYPELAAAVVTVAVVRRRGVEVRRVFGELLCGIGLLVVVLLSLERVVVECIAERRACARQTSPPFAGLPARDIDAHGISGRIELIGVDVPRRCQIEIEILRQAEHYRRVDIAPVQRVGREIVALADCEILDK